MTTTPTTAAPDPVKVAREAVAQSYVPDGYAQFILAGELDDREDVKAAILGARAMQEAMPAQGGGEEFRTLLKEAREKGLIYWEPNTDRGYIQRADMLARIDEALARPAPEVKDADGAEGEEDDDAAVNADIANSVIDWLAERDLVYPAEGVSAGSIIEALDWHETELQRPCRDPEELLREMTGQPTTPAPAASDELVERLRVKAGMLRMGERIAFGSDADALDLAAARIEADAAEMERKDARIAELEGTVLAVTASHAMAAGRSSAVEAERAKLREALVPFAAYADAWHEDEPDSTLVEYNDEHASITLGDCRAARDALGGISGE